jgi:hypothetical protein
MVRNKDFFRVHQFRLGPITYRYVAVKGDTYSDNLVDFCVIIIGCLIFDVCRHGHVVFLCFGSIVVFGVLWK